MKPIIASGNKPSGPLHVGNYLGALRHFVKLQDSGKYQCLFFIADYHSLTERYNPKEKVRETLSVAAAYLAAGLNPKKSTIFVQSHVKEHANLSWLFSTITPVGAMNRMIEYKEKVQQGEPANVGLFTYPILMAADILIYKAQYVPIGDDQRQHLELTRALARSFNRIFGKTFPEPKAIMTDIPRLMSLDNPQKKMSKSLPQGCLFLADSPKVIRQKIKTAVTDSGREIIYDPENKPAISNLLMIYSSFSGLSPEKISQRYKGKGYAEFKKDLAEVLAEKLNPFYQAQKRFSKDKPKLKKMLREGANKASLVAQKTFEEAREKVGLL